MLSANGSAVAELSLAGVAMESLNLEGDLADGRFQAEAALMPREGSLRLKARGMVQKLHLKQNMLLAVMVAHQKHEFQLINH